MNVTDYAVSLLEGPDLSEHRLRELALVRLMGVAIDVILNTRESDVGIRIETAKAMIREFEHVYPQAGTVMRS